MSKNCDCMYDEYDTKDVEIEQDLSKDRSTARKRYHNSTKAKNRSLKTAAILSSKAGKLPENATNEEVHRAILRTNNAAKKSKNFRKQIKAQEQKATPYRK